MTKDSMIYFSQILNAKVRDSSDAVVGRLRDCLIAPKEGQYSPLEFLSLKTKQGKEVFISYEYVESLGRGEVTLKHLFAKIPRVDLNDGRIFLNRDVLDQQIVDVGGARVVRVNDLDIGLFENQMCVLGLDVSFKGLLRRLGMAWLDFMGLLKVNLIDWRKAQPIKGTLKLDTVSKNLNKLHPADLANIIEDLSIKHGSNLVKTLDSGAAAQVVGEMNPELQSILIKYLGPESAAKIIEKMSTDELADLLKTMSLGRAREFLAHLKSSKATRVEQLLSYPDDTAGGLMTTDFIQAAPDWTVERAFQEIRERASVLTSILYLYVADAGGKFLGSVSLRQLIISSAETELGEILKRHPFYARLRLTDEVAEIIKTMTKYNLYTAPVVDDSGRLAGVVTIDDVMRQLEPNA